MPLDKVEVARIALVAWMLALSGCGEATAPRPEQNQESVVVRWDEAALEAIRHAYFGAPIVARALAIVHTCMYDAWAAYDGNAVGTQLGGN